MDDVDKLEEIRKTEGLSVDELLHELRAREKKAVKAAQPESLKLNEDLKEFDAVTIGKVLKAGQKAIYEIDDREDIYELPAGPNLDDTDSVVALFRSSEVTDNGDGTSTLKTQKFGNAFDLCSSERFIKQPLGAFCSGVLVDSDVIATAGHCVDAVNVKKVRFVFGFRMLDENNAQTVINNSEIYSGVDIIARQQVGDGPDWALVHIDRPVTNHLTARYRKTGKISDNQAVHVIGHPCGLPAKFAGGAKVRDNQPDAFFVANLDTYGGNSGSPVFNSETHEVEGILVRGETDFVQQGNCYISLVCPTTGCRGEDCTRTTEFALNDNSWQYNNLTHEARAPIAIGDPAVYTCDVNMTQHVIYRGNNDDIYELSFNGQWKCNKLISATDVPKSVGKLAIYKNDIDKTRHVIYRGDDGNIHKLSFERQWEYNNLTQVVGAPAAIGDPAAYTCDADGSQYVVYRDNNGNIYELKFNGQWSYNNLTRATGPSAVGAPKAVSDPAGYTREIDGTRHVVYLDKYGKIHELWFDGQWKYNNLTRAAVAPPALGNPTVYTWDVDKKQYIVYRSYNGDIYELWLNGQGNYNNLTNAAGAPKAIGNPAVYTDNINKIRHVIYRSNDGKIHDLWFNGQWKYRNLTYIASAPIAIGDPVSYACDVDKTQHVVYRGNDGNIYDLWSNL